MSADFVILVALARDVCNYVHKGTATISFQDKSDHVPVGLWRNSSEKQSRFMAFD